MKAYSEFSIPQNGELIFINRNYNKFYKYLFRIIFTLFPTLLILLLIHNKFEISLNNSYVLLFLLVIFSLFYLLFFFKSEYDIKYVKYYDEYLLFVFENAENKVKFYEIDFFDFENRIDKSDGKVTIYFNKISQLYNRYNRIGCSDLYIINNDFVKTKINVDLINFLHSKIDSSKLANSIKNDFIESKHNYL